MKPEFDSIVALKEALASGALTGEEATQKLSAAIETEYQQEQPRMDFINACEDLLWEIRTEGKMPFVSQVQMDEAFIRSRTKVVRNGRSWSAWSKGLAVAAALVLLVSLATTQLRLNWVTGKSIDDGERYLITGHEVDLSVIQSAIADHVPDEQLDTESFAEVIDFLGFVPALPDMSGMDVQRTLYSLYMTDDYIGLDVLYERAPETLNIIYTCTWYTDAEYAWYTLEQSGEGVVERIAGHDVYVYMNIDRPGFAWSDGLMVCVLSGGWTQDEGQAIVEKMLHAQ